MRSHGRDLIPRPAAYKTFESSPSAGQQPTAVDWDKFSDWLSSQYSHKHSVSMLSNAKRYHEAMLDTSKAAQLRTMTPDSRRLAMQSLAALSKFVGVYENWQHVRRQAGLKWQGNRGVSVVHALLNQEAANAITWLHATLPKLPPNYRVPIVFAALTGLRPSEACNSCALIYSLNKDGKLAEYYDSELSMLQHYKYPQPFLRNTKNAYISFASPQLVQIAASTLPTTHNSISIVIKRAGMPIQIKNLRKNYATLLRSSMEREMIDLIQGRVDGSVFVKHYYRPLIKELRDRVLTATAQLEKELLPLLEQTTPVTTT